MTESKPTFVYVSYIKTTPDQLWTALTSGDFTTQYWFGRRIQSDWRPGARVEFRDPAGQLTDSGEVLVADRPRRLSFTFQIEFDEALRREGPSRVTFELEPAGDAVKLTTIHDQIPPHSAFLDSIRQGWPMILSSLKSLLETGAPLAIAGAAAAEGEEAKAKARVAG